MSKPALLKYTEWQGSSGLWYCNDVSDFTSKRGLWYTPARLLEITLEDFILLLINDFKVDNISFNNNILIYSWEKEHYSLCHKFVLWLNKKAREEKWII